MKQTIQLRLGQHLTMTPQLQQAIRLLQLSTLDLRTEIQQALDANPMLEVAEDEGGSDNTVNEDWEGAGDTSADLKVGEDVNSEHMFSDLVQDESSVSSNEDFHEHDTISQLANIPDDLPVDSSWEDTYESLLPLTSAPNHESRTFENQDDSSGTLREHLMWQMNLTPFSDKDRGIAETIIDSIDERGYLTVTPEEILEGLPAELDVELDEIVAVLHQIQNFDPPGVGARDLQECMLIQLQQLLPDTPLLDCAKTLIRDHLNLLASRDYTQLMRRMKCSQQELQQLIMLVQSLNPRPGNQVTSKQAEYVVPDVVVKKENGAWKVELNYEAIPRVRVNPNYARLVRRADNSSDNTYLKNHLQEARWFIKSLQSRNETLLKVATAIVERQRAFLEHGEEAMKALVLHDVAKTVDMHESTISRVTTQKYMHTPRGIFELKYFFSSHVSTASGGECSATAIRALIKKLIAAENPAKPLSDSKIAEILTEQGINVARRTIAKYRESVAIPSSSERKRLA